MCTVAGPVSIPNSSGVPTMPSLPIVPTSDELPSLMFLTIEATPDVRKYTNSTGLPASYKSLLYSNGTSCIAGRSAASSRGSKRPSR